MHTWGSIAILFSVFIFEAYILIKVARLIFGYTVKVDKSGDVELMLFDGQVIWLADCREIAQSSLEFVPTTDYYREGFKAYRVVTNFPIESAALRLIEGKYIGQAIVRFKKQTAAYWLLFGVLGILVLLSLYLAYVLIQSVSVLLIG